jgi:hypothetical protein
LLRTTQKDNRNGAALFCDHCNNLIEDIGLALFTWKELSAIRRPEGKAPEVIISRNHPSILVEQGKIYTIHKTCIDQFEKAQGGESFYWPELELIDLLVFVIHNVGLNISDVQKRAEFCAEMYL